MTVEYDNINVEADALVGSASIPSLTNVALGTLKVSKQHCFTVNSTVRTLCLVACMAMQSFFVHDQCCLLLQRAVGLGGLKTSKLHALKNVSGVLTPVSLSLIWWLHSTCRTPPQPKFCIHGLCQMYALASGYAQVLFTVWRMPCFQIVRFTFVHVVDKQYTGYDAHAIKQFVACLRGGLLFC